MYEKELAAALEAARRAGTYLISAYEAFAAIPDAPADISTVADRESQELILRHLRDVFPDDALCAEERTATLETAARTGERVWIVDPIDGTRGFAQKNGEFSAMIGFVDRGAIAVGVVLEPLGWRLTHALRGGGCWLQLGRGAEARRVTVTRTAELAEATLVQSRTKDPSRPSKQVQALRPGKVFETHSAGVKLARVARGEGDVYVNHYPCFHDWDICAGHILVTEAGGRVTGLRGEEIRYGQPRAEQTHGLLASNRHLHAAALACLSEMAG